MGKCSCDGDIYRPTYGILWSEQIKQFLNKMRIHTQSKIINPKVSGLR